MKKYKFIIKGHDYEVDILNYENNVVELEVNGTHYSVEMQREVKEKPKTPRLVRTAMPTPSPEESGISKAHTPSIHIKTPLPGTILKILVKVGDKVKKGDTLLIMEAMKMENNIMAEKAGKVSQIKVKEGETVLQDEVLVILD